MINRYIPTFAYLASNSLGKIAGLVFLLVLMFLSSPFSPTVRAQDPLEPPEKPDAESGSRIFANRCANCHGATGEGNGEMAGDLPSPPRDFTDEAFLRTAVPANMFQTITEGRLEAGMPPFGPSSSNPIAEADRWDLIANVFSLGTPPERMDSGRLIYEENCLTCHGEQGQGDGPEAADQETAPTDLTDLRYWSSRSNEMVFAALQDEGIPGHSYKLGEDELWDVTDFSRSFSYAYFDPQAALEPIEQASISGQVTNGSTGEMVGEGTVLLRAFTMDLEEVLTETTTVGADGQYTFELSDVAPDLVYMTSIDYDGLNYNGDPDRLSRAEPELDMPIVVFDKTTDPAVVGIEQVHMVLEFIEDRVLVNEIYVISNNDSAVFVGETGDTEDGVFQLVLPSGAENANFQRSFGSASNFMPATELIQTDRGWADTLPLRPGEGIMNLLATYEVPFEDGTTIAHPLFYDAANATILMPDVGVSLADGEWTDQGAQQMGAAGTFLSYARPGLEAGEALSFELAGRVSRARANTVSVGGSLDGDSTTGMMLGAGVFLLVIVGAVFTVQSWRSKVPGTDGSEIDELLQAVANLDDAYEAGTVDEAQYQKQREKLMNELAGMW